MPSVIELINEALNHDTPSRVPWRARLETALFEIARLQEANRRWSKVADERAIEANGVRAENERLRAELLNASFKLGALRSAAYDVKNITIAELAEEFRKETEAALNPEQTGDGK